METDKRLLSDAERRVSILEYIRKNSENDPKITKSDLMKYLKDSRMMTTHKTIVELIKEGKIKTKRPEDKPHSDYLVVNEENEFNKTYNCLSDIEAIVDVLNKLRQVRHEDDFHFVGRTAVILITFLQRLLIRTNNNIASDKDRQILYTKIIKSMSKVATIKHSDEKTIMNQFTEEINSLGQDEKDIKQIKRLKELVLRVNEYS